MEVTREHIAIYRRAGASAEMLAWAEAEPRQYEDAPAQWRTWVAANRSTPPETLAAMRDDPHPWVRRRVAVNAAMPAEVLTKQTRRFV